MIPRSQKKQCGIIMITCNTPALVEPRACNWPGACRYGLGYPFQAGPRTAGLLCNIRGEGLGMGDAELGLDIVLFDDHRHIDPERFVPIARFQEITDPRTRQENLVLKFPASIGFVPLQARLADGSPHPHAGSGFCMVRSLVYPKARFAPRGEQSGIAPGIGVLDNWCDLCQLLFDGRRLTVASVTRINEKNQQTPWTMTGGGMSPAVQDGEGLLMSCRARAINGASREKNVPGIARWECGKNGWIPVRFIPVGPGEWTEPSLVRDADGSLLFTSRSYKTGLAPLFHLWKSGDAGETWEKIMEADYGRTEAPLCLSRTAGGIPFFSANAKLLVVDGQKTGRAKLAIWELTGDRKALLHPRTVRDFFDSPDFYNGTETSYWRAEHPVGNVVRLADGRWRSLLAYRVMFRETHDSSGAARPQTGLYLEQVVCGGKTLPAWSF